MSDEVLMNENDKKLDEKELKGLAGGTSKGTVIDSGLAELARRTRPEGPLAKQECWTTDENPVNDSNVSL